MSELIREDLASDTIFAPIVPTQQEEEWRRRHDWIVRAIIDQFNIAPQILGIDSYIVESTAIVLSDEQVLLPELGQSKQEHNNEWDTSAITLFWSPPTIESM